MSSKIYIKRLCENCGQEFIARTTVTRFCSHTCNSRYAKLQARQLKEKASRFETIQSTDRERPLDAIEKEYFTVDDAATHLTVSGRTLYRLIAEKKLKKKKLRGRTIILKEDIRIFLAQQ